MEKESRVDYESYSLDLNESDECALEEALALKGEFGGEIIVLTMGGLEVSVKLPPLTC